MSDPDQAARVEGRCRHWHGPDDVLLLALPCCVGFWPCRACHDEAVDHEPRRWAAGSDATALQCGRCLRRFGIQHYLSSPDACPACGGAFNPNCRLHHHLYFNDQEGDTSLPPSAEVDQHDS